MSTDIPQAATTGGTTTKPLVEARTIGPVPVDERTGSTKGLVGLWLGINTLPITVVTGALATTLFGLPFGWSMLALVLGHGVGGVFMALHASQGPTLGVPQMLQARGQFGSKGASLLVVVAIVMFLGFFVSNLVVGAQSFNSVFSTVPLKSGIVIGTIVSMIVTIFGLRLLKLLLTISAIVIAALVVASLVFIVAQGVPTGTFEKGAYSSTGFFSMLAVGAVWQIAYAPYVSDYSRFMPAATGARGAFWGTYAGSVISGIYVMATGALLGVLASNGDPFLGLKETTGGLAAVTLFAFAACSMLCNPSNLYCATLNSLTLVETFRPGWKPVTRARLVTALLLHVLALVIALGLSQDFLTNFTSFVTLLLYALIPWSAINLVDYFLIAHGHYDVEAFFRADGGQYGRWNVTALLVYALGLLIEVPFAVLPQFTGPVAKLLDGVDCAWIVGLLVSGIVYYLAMKKRNRPQRA